MRSVLFCAPLKAPDHPEPSGDREMARLLVRALEAGGFAVEMASRLRMLDRHGDTALMQELADAARTEARAKVEEILARPPGARPSLVFTYHVHYKAPDVAGPLLARALGLPYVVAEGSRAPKRAGGPWAEGHRLAEAALDAADLVLVMNDRDREVLERLAPAGQRLADLPPFGDPQAWPDRRGERRPPRPGEPSRLLAVAMMRPGDKRASYGLLAEALQMLADRAWTLDVVGDGQAGPEVRALFAGLGSRVRFHGLVSGRESLAALYAGADLLVWPAVNEAYGMVFLEGALQSCPALAGRIGGVPGVVLDGRTGRLVEGGSAAAFAAGLAGLLDDPAGLVAMGREAARFAREERTLDAAAGQLAALLDPLLAQPDGTGR